MRIIAVAFDGVLHSEMTYTDEWVLTGRAVAGAKEAMSRLCSLGRVVVFSARCCSVVGSQSVSAWLEEHEIPFHELSAACPGDASVCVSASSLRFSGDWSTTMADFPDFIENDSQEVDAETASLFAAISRESPVKLTLRGGGWISSGYVHYPPHTWKRLARRCQERNVFKAALEEVRSVLVSCAGASTAMAIIDAALLGTKDSEVDRLNVSLEQVEKCISDWASQRGLDMQWRKYAAAIAQEAMSYKPQCRVDGTVISLPSIKDLLAGSI